MCGIVGFWNLDGNALDLQTLQAATQRLRHRGPDDEGYLLVDPQTRRAQPCAGSDTPPALSLPPLETFQNEPFSLGFGVRRLAILDLSPAAHQPMTSQDGRFWIVYNGEIFNYLELRAELASLGYQFRTASDTEVILAAYQTWGKECLPRFNGMWALAIWDHQESRLFLARDRFGEKPLFYTQSDQVSAGPYFAFASEIKALIGLHNIPFDPEPQAIYRYLVSAQFPDPRRGETFCKGIYSLPPGESLMVSQAGSLRQRYWRLPEPWQGEPQSLEKTILEYRTLLNDAITLRLRSDVPVGTCLSGGLDSSTIVGAIGEQMHSLGFDRRQIGERQHTFSAVYPEDSPFNEQEYIQLVLEANSAQGHFVEPISERLRADLEQLVWHQEEPFQSTSIFAQWCVMRLARQHGLSVLLDGQGADELLGGYRPFQIYLGELLREGQLGAALQAARAITAHSNLNGWRFLGAAAARQWLVWLYRGQQNKQDQQPAFETVLTADLRSAGLAGQDPPSPASIPQALTIDQHLRQLVEVTSLPHLLRYEDRNGMAFSIETRLPFLDYRLVEYHFGPAAPYRIREGWSKYILRQAASAWTPQAVVWRKDKVGFATPEADWLRAWLQAGSSWLFDPWLAQDYLGRDEVQSHLERWLDGRGPQPPAWRWLNLEFWLRAWKNHA